MTDRPATGRYEKPRGGHGYLIDGQESPGITTINGILNKPNLTPSAAKITAQYAIDNVAETVGAVQSRQTGNHISFLTRHYRDKWDRKRDLGTRVHAACETEWDGGPATDAPYDVAHHLKHFRQFLADYSPEVLHVELPIFRRATPDCERYAATADAFVNIDGRTAVLDIKTGGVWPEAALQLCGIANTQFWVDDAGVEQPTPQCDIGLILQLSADGYRLHETELSAHWAGVRGAVALWYWQRNSKDAFSEIVR